MPSYSKLKVAELRQLCDARDVDHEGLTKPQLIKALRHFDSAQSVSVDQENNSLDNDEDGSDEGDEGSNNGRVATLPSLSSQRGGFDHSGAETVNWEYRYQLEMARLRDREVKRQAERKKRAEAREAREAARVAREREWENEQTRWNLMGGLQSPSGRRNVAQNIPRVVSSLPNMIGDDAVSFFQAYARILRSNNVHRSEWHKFLPGRLSSKACKQYARLCLEECRRLTMKLLRNVFLSILDRVSKYAQIRFLQFVAGNAEPITGF